MRTTLSSTGKRSVLSLMALALIAAAVTRLPAGVGNLGRTTTDGAGGSSADATVNPTFSEAVGVGEAISAVRDNLVALIDADPNFSAAAVTDPADPNSNSFSVTRQGGAELSHLKICENDPNIDNIGVSFAAGKDAAILNRVSSVAGNGNYRLMINVWDSTDFDQTFATSSFAGDPNGLNGAIKSALMTAGFTVVDDGLNLTIRKPADMVTATRVSSTDTGVVIFCVDMVTDPVSPTGVPALSQFGAFLLMVMVTAAAVLLLRRNARNAAST